MADRSAFARLYQLHAPAVFRRAQRLLGVESEAQEVVQDVFLSLYENPQQFAEKSSMTTFLYSVTTHACFTRLRNSRNRQRLLDQHTQASPSQTASAADPAQERLAILRRALLELPEDVATALVHYCIDGMSHEEIASLLSCSRRHVGDLLARANELTQSKESRPC
jgi:RNA polymerase sigma-70 factor (ECF subfamily)